MPPPRKFDYDAARRRYAAGEAMKALAAEFGVSVTAVWRVVSPKGPACYAKAQAAYYDRNRVLCEGGCGERVLSLAIVGKAKHNPDGRALCVRCRANERRERLLFDADGSLAAVRCSSLDCANGERWQSPENFPSGARHREVRENGIHGQCRACQTRARRDYRRRHRAEDNAYQRAYWHRRRKAAA